MAKIERSEEIVSAESSLQQHEEGTVSEASNPRFEEIVTEDGILCIILSFLTIVEAVRTSVLSPRWRRLWIRRTSFIFEAVNVLDCKALRGRLPCGIEAYKITKGMAPRYIRSVNSILPQLQSARVDEFAFRFFLDKTHSKHLDAWLSSALASKATTLKLHLFKEYTKAWTEPYEFPCHMLSSSSLESSHFIKLLSLRNCIFKLPCKFDGLNHLEILSMINVDINEEDLNRIVYHCSLTLTQLCVSGAPQLVSISIPHPLSRLHILMVRYCQQLRKIEMNVVNLAKLHYEGAPVDIKFRQSLKLKDAYIHFRNQGTVHNLNFYLNNTSDSLIRLWRLHLKTSGVSQVADLPKRSSRFIHLTHLDWEWNDCVGMSLFHLATLLNVAPLLEELRLSFLERVLEEPHQTAEQVRDMLPHHPHTNLKRSKVCGFYFNMWQINISVYLFNHAIKLESMMIESASKHLLSKEIHDSGTKILRQEAPTNVKLVIL